MLKVCMMGLGRTGKIVAKNMIGRKDIQLVMAVCRPGSDKIGLDVGALLGISDTGIKVMGSDLLNEGLRIFKPDVAIDFTNPEACMTNAPVLARNKVNMVIATTGFTDIQFQKLRGIAVQNKVGMVIAPNITLGVNVLQFLCKIAAQLLDDYDVEIMEEHFKDKKDIPSGTAIKIAESISEGRDIEDSVKILTENDAISLRGANVIPIHSLRAGGIVGVHKVMFASGEDSVEIIHRSFTRSAFAKGAIKAAKFIAGRKGVYDMTDVLNLEDTLERFANKQRDSHA
ncbi:4-hydroxy-tetrahydrodipicolinate reductase [Mahella sp.]|jgi:4-hydroxy-tetrahydrodipicolinate reductase|uniref:4-hydroxy-tetrahydrodipicolinate reductase n=1 Tax=Mahella sp. TaxID=2798721 RepID=UPI0025C39B1D|nr:4-hydroxy-tetrahydrodipicolinate reductase [Mahella sp.]MBZ4665853.1 dihydrodipicolinate reductase [Mahella sp.]MDK2903336.1 4-hydroxy-tetrahydrodipicolinate reductase [Clostridiales bacterium]